MCYPTPGEAPAPAVAEIVRKGGNVSTVYIWGGWVKGDGPWAVDLGSIQTGEAHTWGLSDSPPPPAASAPPGGLLAQHTQPRSGWWQLVF